MEEKISEHTGYFESQVVERQNKTKFKSKKDNPLDIVDAWITLESFEPRMTYDQPKDIAKNLIATKEPQADYEPRAFEIKAGFLPWHHAATYSGVDCKKIALLKKAQETYYYVCLGEIKYKAASQCILKLFPNLYEENENKLNSTNNSCKDIKNLTPFALLIVNSMGVPVFKDNVGNDIRPLSISAFGYAFSCLLSNNLNNVPECESLEASFTQTLIDSLQKKSFDDIPLTYQDIKNISLGLRDHFKIPEKYLTEPTVCVEKKHTILDTELEAVRLYFTAASHQKDIQLDKKDKALIVSKNTEKKLETYYAIFFDGAKEHILIENAIIELDSKTKNHPGFQNSILTEIKCKDTIWLKNYLMLKTGFTFKRKLSPPFLGSLYLQDLLLVKSHMRSNQIGNALKQFMGMVEHQKKDLSKKAVQTDTLDQYLAPQYLPHGKWPAPENHTLNLMQQFSVNLSLSALQTSGLLSINGPPGTGKTTLLKDIVAGIFVQRAIAMSRFEDPKKAFSLKSFVDEGSKLTQHKNFYDIDDTLRGYEILVASSNNAAVENITKELPVHDNPEYFQALSALNYFKPTSDALLDKKTWGLIACPLGNKNNIKKANEKIWWGKAGLKNYLKYVAGDFKNYRIKLKPKIEHNTLIENGDPPQNAQEANTRWQKAKTCFNRAIETFYEKAYEVDKTIQALINLPDLNLEIKENEKKRLQLFASIKSLENQKKFPDNELSRLNEYNKLLTQQRKAIQRNKPSDFERYENFQKKHTFFSELFKPSIRFIFMKSFVRCETWLAEKQANDKEEINLIEKIKPFKKLSDSLQKALELLIKQVSELSEKLNLLNQKKLDFEQNIPKEMSDHDYTTQDFWQLSDKIIQTSSPNQTQALQEIRNMVFFEAIKLHKAFIDATASIMHTNLNSFFNLLKGQHFDKINANELNHLWTSFFLLCPVVSTTFASVGLMLKSTPKESLGWLLIDEAGQAFPKSALGAIFRSKRVIVVGDPLQLEPISNLSIKVIKKISNCYQINYNLWTSPKTSIQYIADAGNAYGTHIKRNQETIWIGIPLIVHRRCIDPMFKISNTLAYNGKMICATHKPKGDFRSGWFSVVSKPNEIKGKWSHAEWETVLDLLVKFSNQSGDIFIISPFRDIIDLMKRFLSESSPRSKMYEPEDSEFIFSPSQKDKTKISILQDNLGGKKSFDHWRVRNIGTVHSFQGKQAETVIFLLGAPDQAQEKARNWAAKNLNLLNVAVTRAKMRIFIVGNKTLWNIELMKKLVSEIK